MPNAIRAVSREPKNHKNSAGSTPLRRMYTGENSVTTSGRASRTSGIPLITSNSKPSTSIFTNRTRLAAMRSPARYASRVTVSTSMPALRRLVQEGQKPRPLQASRRRRRCSGPARIRSPGSRSRGNARTHLRRIWAGPRPHRCAPPSRRERSSNALARSRARASAQAPGVDTLGPPRRPTTTTWCMPHPRPRPSDGGMITNRAKRTLVAAPRDQGCPSSRTRDRGSHFGSTRAHSETVEAALAGSARALSRRRGSPDAAMWLSISELPQRAVAAARGHSRHGRWLTLVILL